MTDIDEYIKTIVEEISIPHISAENMLFRINLTKSEKKRRKNRFRWIISSIATISLIFSVFLPIMLKNSHKVDNILEIGFDVPTTSSSLFSWEVALISSLKIEKEKNIQIYYGHNSNFKEVLFDQSYTFNPAQKTSLILKRNIYNDEMKQIASNTIYTCSDSLKVFFIDGMYQRDYDVEKKILIFNQFYDDIVTINELENIEKGYLNYSVTIHPNNDDKLSIIGPNKNDVFISNGVSPFIKFSTNKNGKIKFMG